VAFEGLTQRLQDVFKKLRGKGKISAEDVNLAMREVRLALLEADVNFKVVKDFIGRVKERAVGQEVLQSLTPGQQIIKIVHDEMTALMGGSESKLNFAPRPPSVFIMVGLQGAGKTTTVAKLGKVLVKQGRKPLLVACDIYRPAAIKQLQVLGEQTNLPVFSMGQNNPLDIAKASLEAAKNKGCDTIILDTAGRLHIDQDLWKSINNNQAQAIRQDILLSLQKARLLKADIFGFGDAVYKEYPREWKEIKEEWEDIFPAVEVDIKVQTTLVRPNMVLQSMNK
jgi:signal recognition particle subunit SRP54